MGIYPGMLQTIIASVLVTSVGRRDDGNSLIRISQNDNLFNVLAQLACLHI